MNKNVMRPEIKFTTTSKDIKFTASIHGEEIGYATLEYSGDDKVVATHTVVRPDYRGGGIAAELIKAVVEHCRLHHLKLIPVCSYAVVALQRHPEWQDVLHHDAK